jgi:ATP-dependent DNA helicase RecG
MSGVNVQLELQFPPPRLSALLTPDEIFDRLDQSALETLKEDRRVERKPPGFSGEPLGEYVSMWANTPPDGGLIVLGMSDDGTIAGCSGLSHEQLNRTDKVQDLCPDSRCEIKRVQVSRNDGVSDFLIVIRVYYLKNRTARTPKGEVFARRGDEKRRLKYEEIRQLQIDKGEIAFEQEPCGLQYPDDFDLVAIHSFAESVRSMCEITTNPSDEAILICKHLAAKTPAGELIPNMACALLFAKEPDRLVPGAKIRFFRFDGEQEFTGERRNAVKDIWIEGLTVPRMIQRAEQVLDSQVRTFSALGKDNRFYTAPEYPKSAWYEAVVNACVHRQYGNGLKNMGIYIRMFDDRLEIDSPGPFMPFITPDNIVSNSHPRNPKLMQAMYFMQFVKMAGKGTRRIVDTMQAANFPKPEFAEKQLDTSRVRVTLRNNIKQRRLWLDTDAAAVVGAAIAASLGEEEKRMLNFVGEYGKINVTEAVRLTDMAWETAKAKLDGLVRMGILAHIHRSDIERDPKAHYQLVKGKT